MEHDPPASARRRPRTPNLAHTADEHVLAPLVGQCEDVLRRYLC